MSKSVFGLGMVLVLAMLCTSCGSSSTTKSVGVGAGVGALAGGLIAKSPAGLLAGAAIGGIIGGVVGELSEPDRQYFEESIQIALEGAYNSKYYKWTNPRTGTSGELVLMRSYQNASGQKCGIFDQYMTVKGGSYGEGTDHKVKIDACKNNGGKWYVNKQ